MIEHTEAVPDEVDVRHVDSGSVQKNVDARAEDVDGGSVSRDGGRGENNGKDESGNFSWM